MRRKRVVRLVGTLPVLGQRLIIFFRRRALVIVAAVAAYVFAIAFASGHQHADDAGIVKDRCSVCVFALGHAVDKAPPDIAPTMPAFSASPIVAAKFSSAFVRPHVAVNPVRGPPL
jgi:hypothetical protein